MRRLAILTAAFLGLLADAGAAAAAYVGKWASAPQQCARDQSHPQAPMVIAARRYDQHETHCTFARVRRLDAASWRVHARCSVEGDRQRHTFTLRVSGRTLAMTNAAGTQRLVRCG